MGSEHNYIFVRMSPFIHSFPFLQVFLCLLCLLTLLLILNLRGKKQFNGEKKNTLLFALHGVHYPGMCRWPTRSSYQTPENKQQHIHPLHPLPLDKCSVVVNYIDLGYNSL